RSSPTSLHWLQLFDGERIVVFLKNTDPAQASLFDFFWVGCFFQPVCIIEKGLKIFYSLLIVSITRPVHTAAVSITSVLSQIHRSLAGIADLFSLGNFQISETSIPAKLVVELGVCVQRQLGLAASCLAYVLQRLGDLLLV